MAPPPAPRGWRKGWMLLFIASAAPAAFAVEGVLRAIFLPAELESVRVDLEPALTRAAWSLLAITVPAAALGLWCKRWLVRRALSRRPDASAAQRDRFEVEALLLASSIPQVPALLATVAAMGGARTTPVLITLVVSTLGVLAQGLSRGDMA